MAIRNWISLFYAISQYGTLHSLTRQTRRNRGAGSDCAAGWTTEWRRDFLVDTLLTRPTRDMEAQRRLLREWDEEIDRLEQSIAYLAGNM